MSYDFYNLFKDISSIAKSFGKIGKINKKSMVERNLQKQLEETAALIHNQLNNSKKDLESLGMEIPESPIGLGSEQQHIDFNELIKQSRLNEKKKEELLNNRKKQEGLKKDEMNKKGAGSFDMKPGFLNSPKAKYNSKGLPYFDVPIKIKNKADPRLTAKDKRLGVALRRVSLKTALYKWIHPGFSKRNKENEVEEKIAESRLSLIVKKILGK